MGQFRKWGTSLEPMFPGVRTQPHGQYMGAGKYGLDRVPGVKESINM